MVKNIYEYYAKWIREGRLKVNSDWNRDLKLIFDTCRCFLVGLRGQPIEIIASGFL